jgi:hypothetical protein
MHHYSRLRIDCPYLMVHGILMDGVGRDDTRGDGKSLLSQCQHPLQRSPGPPGSCLQHRLELQQHRCANRLTYSHLEKRIDKFFGVMNSIRKVQNEVHKHHTSPQNISKSFPRATHNPPYAPLPGDMWVLASDWKFSSADMRIG